MTINGVKIETHTLVNVYGRKLIYRIETSGPNWNRVVVERKHRGEPNGNDLVMTRDEARAHWESQRNAGFMNPAAF